MLVARLTIPFDPMRYLGCTGCWLVSERLAPGLGSPVRLHGVSTPLCLEPSQAIPHWGRSWARWVELAYKR